MRTVGMVGIGLMGHGIATNILKHGYSMVLFEHPGNQSLDALIARRCDLQREPRRFGFAGRRHHSLRDLIAVLAASKAVGKNG